MQGNSCLRYSGLLPRFKVAGLAGLIAMGSLLANLMPAVAAELPRAKPDVPPLEILEPAGPWAILSEADTQRYARIFDLQGRGDMKAANLVIADLGNDILMGHVLFQRYLHPTAYRSRYWELSDWLTLYNDHPGASRIYHLAKRRHPSGAANPKRHELRQWRSMPNNPGIKANPPRRQSASKRRQVTKIKIHVRSLLRRERPTQALNYVNARKTQRSLTTHEYDQIRQWIANSYYLENVDDKALRLADAVAKSSGRKVPLSYWTAGLASWRLSETEKAAVYFTKLADADYVSPSTRSAGAYWAARANLAIREPGRATAMLELAAANSTSFYGILAARQLGIDPRLGEDRLEISDEDIIAALNRPGVARAVALAQVGETARAEAEMRRVHGKSKPADDGPLLMLAQHWKLPAAQLEIANYSDVPAIHAGRFPVPDFTPDDGFTLDRALLFAFIRQESKFDSRATSSVGAKGLMQLMPRTAVHVANDRRLRYDSEDRLYEPSYNMKLGQKYIQELMTSYNLTDNLFDLLIAYNGGPGNLRKWKKNTKYNDDPLLFIESIPSRETRGFLEAVSRNFWMYRLTLGQQTPSLDLLASGAWPGYIPIEVEGQPQGLETLVQARPSGKAAFLQISADGPVAK